MTNFDELYPTRLPGLIIAWPSNNNEPDNRYFLECDGTTIDLSIPSNDRYQGLFDSIGSLYGGDGITTFQIPDYRGQFFRNRGVVSDVGSVETEGLRAHQHDTNADIRFSYAANPSNSFNTSKYFAAWAWKGNQPIGQTYSTSGTNASEVRPKTMYIKYYISY